MECKKTKFATEAYAEDYIEKLRKTSKRERIPQSTYLCPNCHAWHLTSKKQRSVETENSKLRSHVTRLNKEIRSRDIIINRVKRALK